MHTASFNPAAGGKLAGVLFALMLVTFVVESQLTQYVQTDLGFRQPYFVFYIVHSAFAIMWPLHFLFLVISSKDSPRAIIRGLYVSLAEHIAPTVFDSPASFPIWGSLRLVVILSLFVSVPALLWFVAITQAPLPDVTALWNTNAFFAYILTVRLFGLRWEARRLLSVVIATAGAALVVYGSSGAPASADAGVSAAETRMALIGDLLTLIASVIYGIYQVLYKMYAAPPDHLEPIPADAAYEPIVSAMDDPAETPIFDKPEMVYPPPFGLYANALTSAIGVCTFVLLWVPIPILHYYGLETFHLPADIKTVSVIACIALSGVAFNATLMILLGLWGPIVTSVGNLLTIVLVFISDIIFGGSVQSVTGWSLLGSGAIIVAFGVLAYDILRKQ
ncbi:uncharacterized protein PHACADRAFT_247425 [Phanerochaete carnosa HHB-10118-sp]|uniref:EamA domain-containing protein n=1 Tax=Phanerochaete carnosa (strain HHB-10118-sp) TaxID=650164 RepID=K5WNN7_PHACS|nr:uncharacterized protein PHACADRAFT_247425 [Phanerochaete carnosa HHB-10118-sp]EKM61070.1 hypothetical protein PHACADRAFT_247425 [Phanerochaete carnosa HHB-10118-sp]